MGLLLSNYLRNASKREKWPVSLGGRLACGVRYHPSSASTFPLFLSSDVLSSQHIKSAGRCDMQNSSRADNFRVHNGRRAKVACKECRQAKVRCNVATPPCSRCVKRQVECSIEPKYRRVHRTTRTRELEDQITSLKEAIGWQNASPTSRSPSSQPMMSMQYPPTTISPTFNDIHVVSEGSAPTASPLTLAVDSQAPTTYSLANVDISHSKAVEAFNQ